MTQKRIRRVGAGNKRVSENGNGNGKGSSQYVPWVAVIISIAAGFWSVANPRDDIKQERAERLEGIRLAKTDMEVLLRRIDDEILRNAKFSSEKYLTKEEHLEFKTGIKEAASSLRDELNRMRGDQVTRSEHQQHWAETAARIDGVRELNVQLRKETFDSISALAKETGGQYTVGDQIKNLQDQLKLLNGRLDQLRMRQLAPAQQ